MRLNRGLKTMQEFHGLLHKGPLEFVFVLAFFFWWLAWKNQGLRKLVNL